MFFAKSNFKNNIDGNIKIVIEIKLNANNPIMFKTCIISVKEDKL